MDYKIQLTNLQTYEIDNKGIKDFIHLHFNEIFNIEIFETAILTAGMFSNLIKLRKVKIHLTEIPMQLFNCCINLKEVDFTNTVIKINKLAFNDCKSLEQPLNANSVTYIGIDAFNNTRFIEKPKVEIGQCLVKYKTEKKSIVLSNYSMICNNCFENNENLINITINSSVRLIESYAFNNCFNLEFIKVSSNTIVQQYAFNNTSWENEQDDLYVLNGILYRKENIKFTKIILPNNTIIIPDSIFKNCTSLETVIFNNNLKFINSNAFSGCILLKSIKIDSINTLKIDDLAFANCTGLREAIINSEKTEVHNQAFFGCNNLNKKIIDKHEETNWFLNMKT